MSPPGAELAVSFFTICNILRLVAYFPQLMCVIRDRRGAAAVSCWSWVMFSLANGSTALYAGLVLHDRVMMVIFVANTLASSAILVMTLVRRRAQRSAAQPQLAG
jgi:predicted MFS family arabinose efflux permease